MQYIELGRIRILNKKVEFVKATFLAFFVLKNLSLIYQLNKILPPKPAKFYAISPKETKENPLSIEYCMCINLEPNYAQKG